jgi:hypothetical protein
MAFSRLTFSHDLLSYGHRGMRQRPWLQRREKSAAVRRFEGQAVELTNSLGNSCAGTGALAGALAG